MNKIPAVLTIGSTLAGLMAWAWLSDWRWAVTGIAIGLVSGLATAREAQ